LERTERGISKKDENVSGEIVTEEIANMVTGKDAVVFWGARENTRSNSAQTGGGGLGNAVIQESFVGVPMTGRGKAKACGKEGSLHRQRWREERGGEGSVDGRWGQKRKQG